MKLLYILNETNRVNNFSYSSMKAAQKIGIEFSIAGNWNYSSEEERLKDELLYGIKIYQIDFNRSPFSFDNRKAFKQLKQVMNIEKFDIIHCNTPIGGIAGRVLGKKLNTRLIIYQAHGFHFYKGAPIKNWVLFYSAERFLARYTDALITINKEDYERGKKFHLKNNGKVYYVPGVGIDIKEFTTDILAKTYVRKELGITSEAIMLLMVGELNKNKNVVTAIKAIGRVENKNLHLVLCGKGPEENNLRELSKKLGVENRVHFVGFRKDIKQILSESDIYIMASFREGLSRSIMEAMASGMPCIVSDIRGNRDLIKHGEGGYLCKPIDVNAYANAIDMLVNNADKRHMMGEYNRNIIVNYSTDKVISDLENIYKTEIAHIMG